MYLRFKRYVFDKEGEDGTVGGDDGCCHKRKTTSANIETYSWRGQRRKLLPPSADRDLRSGESRAVNSSTARGDLQRARRHDGRGEWRAPRRRR